MKITTTSLWLSLLCFCACDPPATPSGPGTSSAAPAASPTGSAAAPGDEAAWLLAGSQDERFAKVAKHLRGFDVAMAETGYRYSELYWAGKDRNWEYADYQLRKIQTTIANGVERRPRRAASARMLDGAVTAVKDAIAKRDGAALDTAFGTLTETCNACHRAEKMGFVRVAPPSVRTSVVVAPAEGSP